MYKKTLSTSGYKIPGPKYKQVPTIGVKPLHMLHWKILSMMVVREEKLTHQVSNSRSLEEKVDF